MPTYQFNDPRDADAIAQGDTGGTRWIVARNQRDANALADACKWEHCGGEIFDDAETLSMLDEDPSQFDAFARHDGTPGIPICATCGSADIAADAFAQWNPVAQGWEVSAVMDNGHACERCGGECSIEWRDTLEGEVSPTCEPLRDALLQLAENFLSGFEDDESQEGIPELLAAIRATRAQAKARAKEARKLATRAADMVERARRALAGEGA
jgi:hypothetical protein